MESLVLHLGKPRPGLKLGHVSKAVELVKARAEM